MIVLFYPDYPGKEFYTIVPIFMRLGFFATRDTAADFDFAVAWQDETWLEDQPLLDEIAGERPVVNLRCRDISKTRVEQVFTEVFGRSTLIDPIRHSGPCVKKHDENALGGSIVQCPLTETDARFVYQRFIDSAHNGRMIEYRLPVVFEQLPLLYTQEKALPRESIKTEKFGLSLGPAEEVFSAEERDGILEFCRRMGLDFGELDILRANDDGRIYILDANKTPGGFGMLNKMNWQAEQRRIAIERLSAAFEAGIRRRLSA